MMTSAQVVKTSINVTSNSPSQDYTHPDDHNLPNYDIMYCKCDRQDFFASLVNKAIELELIQKILKIQLFLHNPIQTGLF